MPLGPGTPWAALRRGFLMCDLATYGLGIQEHWSGSPLGPVPNFALAFLVTPLLTTPPLPAGHPTLCYQGWSLIPPSNPRCLPSSFLPLFLKTSAPISPYHQSLF